MKSYTVKITVAPNPDGADYLATARIEGFGVRYLEQVSMPGPTGVSASGCVQQAAARVVGRFTADASGNPLLGIAGR